MTTDTYQGYTNHATWVVDLWLSNTESAYHMLDRIATTNNHKSNEQRALELRHKVYNCVDKQKHLPLDSRGERWGRGIAGDLDEDEQLESVNFVEIIENAREI